MPTDNANEIVLSKWEGWAKDPAQKNWTVPFSALLQKLWEGAPKNIIQKDKIDPAVAIRMVNLLIDIQKNPSPFIPLVSTLERSSLVTRGHRPLLSFLELELEVKAHTTRSGFEAGRKNWQDVLDVKLERRVYEVTYKNIRRELNKSGVEDKAEAALAVWARLYRTKALLVPGLLYHLRGSVSSETSYEVNTECEAKARNNWFVDIAKITDQVVSGVKQALLHG